MGRFSGNPDYGLDWPAAILRIELEALIDKASRVIDQREWRQEVTTLLRQAFVSDVPFEEFNGETGNAGQDWFLDEPF